MGFAYYRCCWHAISNPLFIRYCRSVPYFYLSHLSQKFQKLKNLKRKSLKNFKNFLLYKLRRTKQKKSTASSLIKTVYNPKVFIPHAASLGHTFVHCRRFSTAATRRCLASVSVPMLGITLSRPLPVIVLVSHYLTNKLIGRGLIPKHYRLLTQ